MSVEAKKLIDLTLLSCFKELMDQSVDGKLSRLKIDLVQIVSVLPELDAAEEGVLYWVPAKGDGEYEIWAKENVDGTPTMVRNFSIAISGDLEGFLTKEDAKATYFNRVTVADDTITLSRPDGSTVVITVNNVAHATKADQDGTGAVIAATYATKAELTAHATAAESTYVQTGAVDQTVGGTKTFPKPIVGSVTGSSGSCTGNAASATKLQTARTINGTGFNGTANITTANWGTARSISITDGTNTSTAVSVNGSANVSLNLPSTIKATFVGNITGNVTGNCSGSSGSCTGNAATATKLAAKRTIALSGAATGTATGFDGSGNITIPVTALSGSAITSAISIYDLVPDGAANHRNFYRGKDLTAAFNAGTVSTNIANGTFRDIFPGDYIRKSITVPRILKADGKTEYIAQKTYTVNFVIADLDIWLNRGEEGQQVTAHHVAIVPQRCVFYSVMNEGNTTQGGYVGSFMNTNVMPAFATALRSTFGSAHILPFSIGLTDKVNATTACSGIPQFTGSSNWWGVFATETCCLMSEGMVYGAPVTASSAMDDTMIGQFSAFRLNNNLIHICEGWWLSDVASSAFFSYANALGRIYTLSASNVRGVRPFALLK